MAYDRSDAREQRRNELAARLADARRRARISRGPRWQGAVAPLLATAALLGVTPDLLRVATGGSSWLAATGRSVATDLWSALRASSLGAYVDEPPVAAGDSDVSTTGPVVLVLGGTDPDGDPLRLVITSPPQHGTLTQQGAPIGAIWTPGPVLYTPTPGYEGDDYFLFAVSDGTLTSALSLRSLHIYAPSVPAAPPTSAPVGLVDRRATGDDFSLQRPDQFRHAQVTPEYLLRAQEVLDARPEAQPLRPDGRVSADHGVSLPPLVTTSELGGPR